MILQRCSADECSFVSSSKSRRSRFIRHQLLIENSVKARIPPARHKGGANPITATNRKNKIKNDNTAIIRGQSGPSSCPHFGHLRISAILLPDKTAPSCETSDSAAPANLPPPAVSNPQDASARQHPAAPQPPHDRDALRL